MPYSDGFGAPCLEKKHREVSAVDTESTEAEPQADAGQAELVSETLVEEVSIDGMCGVY